MRTENGLLSAGPQAELNAFFIDLGQIGAIRAAVDSGSLSPTAAFQAYSNVIDAQLHSFEASDQDNKGGTLAGTSVGAIQADYGVEMASQEATLADGALADRGLMSAAARQLFDAPPPAGACTSTRPRPCCRQILNPGSRPSPARRFTSGSRPWKTRSPIARAMGRCR